MSRFGRRVLISPSQEEVLEAITGWDDIRQGAGIIDETPSQHAYAENSSQSSLERLFDVTGPSLCSAGASQEAVELISPTDMPFPSPRTTRDAAMEEREEEDSCHNKGFESDTSHSPHKTVSWNLAAGAHGKDGPKSPTISTSRTAVAVEELGKSPLSSNPKLVRVVEVSNRPSAVPPEAAGVTIGVRAEMEVDQEVEETADERSGRREGPATVRAANGGGGGSKTTGSRTTGDCVVQQHVSSIGIGLVSPQEWSLPKGGPALEPSSVESGSASAFKSVRSMEKGSQQDFQPGLSVEHHNVSRLEGETSVRSADSVLDQIANSVQDNMLVVDKMEVVEDDHWGMEVKSGDNCGNKRSRAPHEPDTVERVGEIEGCVRRVVSLSKVSRGELGTALAADHCQGGKELVSWQEKSREPPLSPTPSKSAMDAAIFRSVDKIGGAAAAAPAFATGGGGQCTPSSPPRPPRAVQEKLDKLRNQSGSKRARTASFNLLKQKLRTERDMVSASTALEAIKLRSGERPATNVTAADLLKTALDVGITLPPPFHRNYFSG